MSLGAAAAAAVYGILRVRRPRRVMAVAHTAAPMPEDGSHPPSPDDPVPGATPPPVDLPPPERNNAEGPAEIFRRLSPMAMVALSAAGEEARGLDNSWVGPEHLIPSLLQLAEVEEGRAREARATLARIFNVPVPAGPPGPRPLDAKEISLAPRLKAALKEAVFRAASQAAPVVTACHLLHGALRLVDATTKEVLSAAAGAPGGEAPFDAPLFLAAVQAAESAQAKTKAAAAGGRPTAPFAWATSSREAAPPPAAHQAYFASPDALAAATDLAECAALATAALAPVAGDRVAADRVAAAVDAALALLPRIFAAGRGQVPTAAPNAAAALRERLGVLRAYYGVETGIDPRRELNWARSLSRRLRSDPWLLALPLKDLRELLEMLGKWVPSYVQTPRDDIIYTCGVNAGERWPPELEMIGRDDRG